jgi:hypothetical protein
MSAGLDATVRMNLEDFWAESPSACLPFVVACRDNVAPPPSVTVMARSFGLITMSAIEPHASVREIVNRIAAINGDTVVIN